MPVKIERVTVNVPTVVERITYICDKCVKEFKDRSDFNNHLREEFEQDNPPLFNALDFIAEDRGRKYVVLSSYINFRYDEDNENGIPTVERMYKVKRGNLFPESVSEIELVKFNARKLFSLDSFEESLNHLLESQSLTKKKCHLDVGYDCDTRLFTIEIPLEDAEKFMNRMRKEENHD